MFQSQQHLLDQWPHLIDLLARYELDSSSQQLADVLPLVRDFKMRLPLVGAFSAGKSSLLNTLLGEKKLLSVEITPETALATELHFADQEQIFAHLRNGETKRIDREELKKLSESKKDHQAHQHLPQPTDPVRVMVHLPNPVLKQLPHICLVDLPGLDAGLGAHNQAIDDYMSKSLAYCVMASVADGTLKQSTQEFLTELKLHDAPVLLVMSKIDHKQDDDSEQVHAQIASAVEKTLGRAPLATVACSARKKQGIDDFMAALLQLEQLAEPRFVTVIGRELQHAVQPLRQRLTILMNSDDLNHEDLINKKQQIKNDAQWYQNKIAQDSQLLQGQLSSMVDKIVHIVSDRLIAQLDSFAHALKNGAGLEEKINQTARLAMTEAIQSEFLTKVQDYIQNLEVGMPPSLRIDAVDLPSINSLDSNLDMGDVAKMVGKVGMVVFRAHPILATLMPILTDLLGAFLNQKQREAQATNQHEQAKSVVIEQVIPQVLQQIQSHTDTTLRQQLQQVERNMLTATNTKVQNQQAALSALDVQLQQGKAAFEAAQQGYAADLAQVEAILKPFQ